jgi:Pin2-interacting protein X1
MSSTSDFAKRQLERMGWTEGSGLGKERQGRASPILVEKRSDETGGLGIEQEKARIIKHTVQTEWWKDTLGDTLAKLSGSRKKKKRKLDGATSKEPENRSTKLTFTDEELFAATGGARFGMRAGITRNQSKWRRTEERENTPLKPKETSLELVGQRSDITQNSNHASADSKSEIPASEAAVSESKKRKKKVKRSKSGDKGARRKSSEESTNRIPKENPKKAKKPKMA